MVQITPAAARPNPFAGHFPFPAPELNHLKEPKQVFHIFMINDQPDTKIWPSKAQTSVKNYYLKNSVRQIQSKSWKHLSESLQSTASIYMLLHFGYHLTIHPKCWEILCQHEVCPMLTHQSWQAASISRFRTAAALSSSRRCAWWQTVHDTFFQPFRNAISRQSLGKFLVMVLVWWLPSWCITQKLLFHWFIAFLSQASLP